MRDTAMSLLLVSLVVTGVAIEGCSGGAARGPVVTGASGGAAVGAGGGPGDATAASGGANAGSGGATGGTAGAVGNSGGQPTSGGVIGSGGVLSTGGTFAASGGSAGPGGASGKGGAMASASGGAGGSQPATGGAGGPATANGGGGVAGLGGMTAAGGAGMCPTAPACAAPHLVPTQLAPDLISATATHFYYVAPADSNSPRLWRIGLGGDQQQDLYDGGLGAVAIDPSESAAYLGIGSVYKLPLDAHGAAGAIVQLDPHPAPAAMTFTGLAVDGGTLYYSTFSTGTDATAVGLFKIPAAGGSPQLVLKADLGRGVAVHGDYVYFSGDLIQGTNGASGIVQLPRAGGSPRLVYNSPSGLGPDRFVVTDTAIYLDSGSLMRIPLDGGAPVSVFTATSNADMFVRPSVFAVAADAVYYGATVYTATATLAQIFRIPLDGGAVSTPFSTDAFVDVGNILAVGGNVYFGSKAKSMPGILGMNPCGCAP